MKCPMKAPGECPACKRRVRWADLQSCPNRGNPAMSTPCICPGPGYCTKYARQMDQGDWDICSGAVGWLKDRHAVQWVQSSGSSCAFDGGPLLDEYGIQRKKRGCGCGGVPAIVGYKVCSHPQMVASKTPGEDACELRCAFFQAKAGVDAVKNELESV
jgi:hypothetical protein